MKTIELIALLTPKELKKFEAVVIKKHKRTSLKNLYFYLKKNKKIDKEAAFYSVFKTAYESQKDVLFRNELRLLNKELELFLVEIDWRKQLQNNHQTQLSLIKIYLEREEFNLFEQSWKKLYKKTKIECLYALKIELILLFFDYATLRMEISFELYQQLKNLLTEAMMATIAQMQEDYKQLELKDAFVQRNLYALSGQSYQPIPIPAHYSKKIALENDTIIEYLDYMIQSYFLEGYPKIELLKKAFNISDGLFQHKKHKTLAVNRLINQMSIGLEYFLLKEYQKADEIYTVVLAQNKLLPSQKKPGIYFNYVTNLICLGAYQRAIDWYESSDEYWKKIPTIAYRIQYLLCWAYIMQKEYQKPLDLLLTHNIQQRPESDFIYARLLLTIVYYSNDQMELAEREVYNLIQNSRYKIFREEIHVQYSKFLYQHIRTINLLDAKQRNEKLSQIQNDLDKLYHNNNNMASTMLYQWLSKQNACNKI